MAKYSTRLRTLSTGLGAIIVTTMTWAANASDLQYFTTVTNTDVATFSIGDLRDNGTGTLAVAGLSGSISGAYLFWHGPTNSDSLAANAAVSFGGNAITGTNIGVSQDNAWGYLNSQAYRADVTGIVSGNGAYALSDFLKTSGNTTTANINGAELIVFYNDGNAANNHDVVLFDGNDSNFVNTQDADGWNATLNGVNYTGGTALMTLGVSDGQHFFNGDDRTMTFNGTQIGTGNDFDGLNSQHGNGATPGLNGDLWDVSPFDVTSLITTGTNTLFQTPPGLGTGDALSLVTAMFTLPVGAAPPPPSPAPEPATWAMMIAGFGMVGAAMRRRTTTVCFG